MIASALPANEIESKLGANTIGQWIEQMTE